MVIDKARELNGDLDRPRLAAIMLGAVCHDLGKPATTAEIDGRIKSPNHEAMGVARGRAKVRFGGKTGRELELEAGDVAILPAGTGHQCLKASRDFMVVGAYPPDGEYDLCRARKAARKNALDTIPQVPLPKKDPAFGTKGPLKRLWRG